MGPPVGVDSVSRDSSLPSRSTTDAPADARLALRGGGEQTHAVQHRQRRAAHVDRLTRRDAAPGTALRQ